MIRKRADVLIMVAVVGLFLGSAPTNAGAEERWQWSITPYLWATDINETLRAGDFPLGGNETEFADLVDTLDTSFQLRAEGMRGRWGVFGDLSHVSLSDTVEGEFGYSRIDVEIEDTVFEGGATWRPGGSEGRFDVLAGIRTLEVDEQYRFRLDTWPTAIESRLDETFVDALVGLRYTLPIAPRWTASAKADISAGGTDLIWTAQALAGWRFGSKLGSAVVAGYRYRELEYAKGELDVEKTLSGFVFAVRIGL